MRKQNGANYSMSRKAQARRSRVLERLSVQLQGGKKNVMAEGTLVPTELTPADVTRIQRDIETLKKRC